MATLTPRSLFLFSCFLLPYMTTILHAYSTYNNYINNPELNSSYITETPNNLILNTIDSCWRSNSNWDSNRQALADCAVGFGKDAIGGKFGAIYEVTDSSDDPVNPKPGTLRYGVIQTRPLWIIFAKDMVITLENELLVNSYKTIDGRGAIVEIAYGPCITIQDVAHVIIHGISIHNCKLGDASFFFLIYMCVFLVLVGFDLSIIRFNSRNFFKRFLHSFFIKELRINGLRLQVGSNM